MPHSPALLQVSIESRAARSRLGTYYERRRDGSRTLFTADEAGSATVTALRAWVGVGVAPGTDGYKPSMLQCAPACGDAAGPLCGCIADRCAEAFLRRICFCCCADRWQPGELEKLREQDNAQ
jgi:hypothetical protein